MVNVIDKQSQLELRDSALDPHNKQTGAEPEVDDDGKPKRTGSVWSATTHIITAVIGAGVLALPWGVAQLGWIAGIAVLFIFALISLYTYNLLSDCYRFPDPFTGSRNYTYMQAVKAYLGGRMHMACGLIQYGKLAGVAIGYTITTSTSIVAIHKSNCFHQRGHEATTCKFSNNPYMLGFGVLQIFLSQIPNFQKLTWLSTVAAITSFGYAFIGTGLSLALIISGKGHSTTTSGVESVWKVFSALGNIALACSYATIMFDIEDTLRSHPPENKQMKRANLMGISTMAILFLMCGGFGYAAFGDHTPGNMLTGFGFYDPFWLVDLGNLFIVIHLVGAYQVMVQPVYRIVEMGANMKWPNSVFINREHSVRIGKVKFNLNLFRLIWRTVFVIVATILSMAMPYFNEMLALLGALGFWPLTVFFPIQMHIAQKQIRKLSFTWLGLQLLSFACFLVSIAAACGAIHGLNKNLHKYKPFMYKQ